MQVCGLSSSLPRQINCCFNHLFFLFHLFLISPCSEIECSNFKDASYFSSLPVLLSSCHNLPPTPPPTPPPISSFRFFLVLQNYIFLTRCKLIGRKLRFQYFGRTVIYWIQAMATQVVDFRCFGFVFFSLCVCVYCDTRARKKLAEELDGTVNWVLSSWPVILRAVGRHSSKFHCQTGQEAGLESFQNS